MVGRFGSLRRLRAFKTRVSDVLRASEPLEICVSDVFHAFEISKTRVGDAIGVFCISTNGPILTLFPIFTGAISEVLDPINELSPIIVLLFF